MLVLFYTFVHTCVYIDIDECAEGTDECDEHCYNTVGSYSCDCTSAGPGYRLHSDGTTCESKPHYFMMVLNSCRAHPILMVLFNVALSPKSFEIISRAGHGTKLS